MDNALLNEVSRLLSLKSSWARIVDSSSISTISIKTWENGNPTQQNRNEVIYILLLL
jgi:hypothetical protein